MATETTDQRLVVRETHERLNQYGAQSLSVVELVAIVLGAGATKEAFTVAESLLIQSGGLQGIARLGLRELEALHGMGAAKARQLRAALELGKRLVVSVPGQRSCIKTPVDAAQLFMVEMGLLEQEEVHTLLLDARNRVMGTTMIYRGSLNSTSMRTGEIFRDAVRNNCSSVIVTHNHPLGDPTPSAEDVHVTRALVAAGKLLDVELLDHIIVSQGRYVSLKERGLGFDASS